MECVMQSAVLQSMRILNTASVKEQTKSVKPLDTNTPYVENRRFFGKRASLETKDIDIY